MPRRPLLETEMSEEGYQKKNDRPQECSSKIPVNFNITSSKSVKYTSRDPRFDSLCGTLNQHDFKKSYKFVDEIRIKEKERLQKMLKTEKDEGTKKKIKYLLTRMDNQNREESRKQQIIMEKMDRSNKIKQLLIKGKKPYFPKKSEEKLFSFINSFEDLKSKGKLENHMKKKMKKKKRKGIYKTADHEMDV